VIPLPALFVRRCAAGIEVTLAPGCGPPTAGAPFRPRTPRAESLKAGADVHPVFDGGQLSADVTERVRARRVELVVRSGRSLELLAALAPRSGRIPAATHHNFIIKPRRMRMKTLTPLRLNPVLNLFRCEGRRRGGDPYRRTSFSQRPSLLDRPEGAQGIRTRR